MALRALWAGNVCDHKLAWRSIFGRLRMLSLFCVHLEPFLASGSVARAQPAPWARPHVEEKHVVNRSALFDIPGAR